MSWNHLEEASRLTLGSHKVKLEPEKKTKAAGSGGVFQAEIIAGEAALAVQPQERANPRSGSMQKVEIKAADEQKRVEFNAELL